MQRFIYCAFALLFINFTPLVWAEKNSVSLVSYYPSPIGAYDRLRFVPQDELTGSCQDGSFYFNASDKNLEYCKDNVWLSSTGIWTKRSHPPGFDKWVGAAKVDQFFFSTSYPDLTKRKPWVGIGTDNPQAPLHLVGNSTGTPSLVHIENRATTHGSEGPGACLSFYGDTHEEYVALRAIYTDLTNAQAESHLALFLRDGTGAEERKFVFAKSGFLGLNYVWTYDLPPAMISILGNAKDKPPFAVATANTLTYLMISSNNIPANNGNVLVVDLEGKVGINQQTPTEQLEVFGNIKATSLILPSDATLKENVAPISNALDKIAHLNGVSFEWINNAHQSDQRQHMGVTAQNIEKIFPEIVYSKNGTKSVDYPSLISPLIEAVKDLKQRNEILKQQFEEQSALIYSEQQQIKSLQNSLKNKMFTLKRGVQ